MVSLNSLCYPKGGLFKNGYTKNITVRVYKIFQNDKMELNNFAFPMSNQLSLRNDLTSEWSPGHERMGKE